MNWRIFCSTTERRLWLITCIIPDADLWSIRCRILLSDIVVGCAENVNLYRAGMGSRNCNNRDIMQVSGCRKIGRMLAILPVTGLGYWRSWTGINVAKFRDASFQVTDSVRLCPLTCTMTVGAISCQQNVDTMRYLAWFVKLLFGSRSCAICLKIQQTFLSDKVLVNYRSLPFMMAVVRGAK